MLGELAATSNSLRFGEGNTTSTRTNTRCDESGDVGGNSISSDGSSVHVWVAHLDLAQNKVEALRSMLSTEEENRASAFRYARDRERFVVSHGVLRMILATYAGADPSSLAFGAGPLGKPSLVGKHAGLSLHFNMSHSHALALYAVCRGGDVGIDVEFMRPEVDWMTVARACFHPRDLGTLASLNDGVRSEAFFRLWTRKEAWAKATGSSLTDTLGHWMPWRQQEGPRGVCRTWVHDLNPYPRYVGALAAAGPGSAIRTYVVENELL